MEYPLKKPKGLNNYNLVKPPGLKSGYFC